MTKLLYLALLAAIVWKAYGYESAEDRDITDTTQNDREIKCGKDYAQYPNPRNCSTYIVCQNGQKTIKSCPRGEHYNFQTIRCEEKCKAYCDKTLSCECKWSTCEIDDVCFLEKINGGCRDRMDRYFFNKRTGQCEKFVYSGCRGNDNNFGTIEECEQKCRKSKPIPSFRCLTMNGLFPNPDNCKTFFECSNGKPNLMACPGGTHYSDKTKRCEWPCDAYCDKSLSCKCKWPTCGLDDLCFLPPETGPCRAGFYNYYFNRRTGQCEKFLYGGCRGNKNNFQKKEECEKACSKTKPIPSFKCLSQNGLFPNPDNCRTFFQCSNGEPHLMTCPEGLHYSDKTERCEKPCDAYCDKSLSCKCKWPTCGLKELCFLPPESGDCRGGFNNYYFNRRTGQCEEFPYGGCGGNKNNFQKKEECEQTCKKPKPSYECLNGLTGGHFPNPDNCNTFFRCSYNEPSGEHRVSLMSCPRGLHFNDKTKRCDRPCDAYCDNSLSCKCKWPTCGMDDLCFLSPETGHCRAAFRHYYFNRRTGQCENFIWGGCGGNKNNFKKKEQCEQACNNGGGECTDHERFTECGAACQRTCKNYKEETIPCPLKCERGCVCKRGFARSSKGQCVPDAECENDNSEGTGEEPSIDEYPSPNSEESTEPSVNEYPSSNSEESTEPPVNEYPVPNSEESTEPPVNENPESNSEEYSELTAEEVLDTSFKCGPDGVYRHPTNCKNFVVCSKSVPTLFSCPTAANSFQLHFNNKTKHCESPCLAHCDPTLACKCKWPTCKSKAFCLLPHKPGPCKGKFERFYHDKRTGKCKSFQYGGCQGNENNFRTKDDCEKKCKQNAYPLVGCSQENSTWTNVEDCSTYYKCSGGETQLVSCPTGQHYSVSLHRCTAPCDAYCEPSIACKCGWPTCKKSEDFTCVKDGLFKDPESCSSYIHCVNGQKYDIPCPAGDHFNERTKSCESASKAQCHEHKENLLSVPSFCDLPSDPGSCRNNVGRWYYIARERRCWKFTYGGCGGNGNNFYTRTDCENVCMRPPYSEANICRLPAEKGPCDGYFKKYYFNHKEGKCENFTYGGCKGNKNRFNSIEECELSCLRNTEDISSEPICTEDGVRPDFESCDRYIQCSNSQRQIVTCPRGLHFNEATKECDSPCDARCDMSLAFECGWPVGSE